MATIDTPPTLQVRDKIDHAVLLDMIRVTMLIYNYGKQIKIEDKTDEDKTDEDKTDEDKTDENNIESFVTNLKKNGEFDNIDMSDIRKRALNEIADNVPSGKLCCFIDDNITDIQAGVTISKNKKRICVAFRGSESRTDWYYDLMIMKHKIKERTYVHSGFHTQLTQNGTYDKLKFCVTELLKANPEFTVYICGHSLGAALSTLFGFMFSHEVENSVIVCSFASPRVGNDEWKKQFESKTNLTHFRITNKRDIVTAFPMYKYYHVGNNIQLEDGKYNEYSCDVKRGWFDESLFTCWSISEHDCNLYYKRLLSNIW